MIATDVHSCSIRPSWWLPPQRTVPLSSEATPTVARIAVVFPARWARGETEDLTGRDGEAQPIQGNDVTIVATQSG